MKTLAFALSLACLPTFAADECSWTIRQPLAASGQSFQTNVRLSWSRGEADDDKVDVLLAFDQSAFRWLSANGYTMDSFSESAVEQMNAILAQTSLDKSFTFRLAGTHLLSLDLSDWSLLFMPFYASGKYNHRTLNGCFEPLRACRNAVAADLVAVLIDTNDKDFGGTSDGMTKDQLTQSGMSAYAEHAYAVCSIERVFTHYTLMHEIGHLMGAGHSDCQYSSPGPQTFPYSAGYYFSSEGTYYTTVMGYPSAKIGIGVESERLPFFSSPNFTYEGTPVGTEKKNDNTRTLRETCRWVANFRVARQKPGDVPVPPSSDDKPMPPEHTLSLKLQRANGSDIADGDAISIYRFENERLSVVASASSAKASVKVKGLPRGLKYTAKTGLISGFPQKAGSYMVTVTASAKACPSRSISFRFDVADVPSCLPGTYVGLLTDEGGITNAATVVVSQTGKVTLKCRFQGAKRTFSAQGFATVETETGGLAFSAVATARIRSVIHERRIVLSDRMAKVDDEGFMLAQVPWGRKDMSVPRFKKPVRTSWNGLDVRVSGKGIVRMSGKMSGIRILGSFQLVQDGNHWLLPVAFDEKRGFPGWCGWLEARLTVSAANVVTGMSLEGIP